MKNNIVNEAKQLFEDRISLLQLTPTEKTLIEHIRMLHGTMESTKEFTPGNMQKYIERVIELSKQIIDVVLTINPKQDLDSRDWDD